MVSDRVIERLIVYRRLLRGWAASGRDTIYSHELAALAGGTAAQVRRDIMAVRYIGSPARGYDVSALVAKIDELLGAGVGRAAALVGIGHLGQALMAYFNRRGSQLTIAAAFDSDPAKVGRVLHGCHCFALDAAAEVIREHALRMAILAVPEAAAQPVAERLVDAGIAGLLNFAPARLVLPADVYVENVDIAILVEKVAFFARAARAVEGVAS